MRPTTPKGRQMKDKVKNEETKLAKEELTDLAVAEEQAGETKAGGQTKATPTLFLAVCDGDH